MTIQEAIKDIKECIKPVTGGTSLDMAIQALEKQIPMLATETQELLDIEYMCPICGCISDSCAEYCRKCGQMLC